MKIIIAFFFIAILVSLFGALGAILRGQGSGNRVVTALAVRVGLSIALFVMLLVAYRLGWITPSGLNLSPR